MRPGDLVRPFVNLKFEPIVLGSFATHRHQQHNLNKHRVKLDVFAWISQTKFCIIRGLKDSEIILRSSLVSGNDIILSILSAR